MSRTVLIILTLSLCLAGCGGKQYYSFEGYKAARSKELGGAVNSKGAHLIDPTTGDTCDAIQWELPDGGRVIDYVTADSKGGVRIERTTRFSASDVAGAAYPR